MKAKLVLLGTKGGPAIRPGGPSPTSSLLTIDDKVIVIDCGLGVARGIVEAGVNLPQITDIFITHLHSDHVLEFGPLLHTAWTAGLGRPVRVFGPKGTKSLWNGFLKSMAYDIGTRISDEGRQPLAGLVDICEYCEGTILGETGLNICALKVPHPPVEECFALRFSHQNISITFSADCAYFPPLAEFSRGCDILVHEAMHPDGLDRLVAKTPNASRLKTHLEDSHTYAEDVGKIAKIADVKLLVLNHLVPADDPLVDENSWRCEIRKTWDGPLIIGHDGLELDLTK